MKQINEKKPQGWFSRRHETNQAHLEAKVVRANRASMRPKQVWNEETKQWEKTFSQELHAM